MTAPYPLAWPEGWARAKGREAGRFSTPLNTALKNVTGSLVAFGRDSRCPVSNIVISSNVSLGVTRPADPGVAVWFLWDGEHRCIPVDRYLTPEANLQAIHDVLEARRVELRHGSIALARATFKGFTHALAAPGRRPWWEVLQVKRDAGRAEIIAAHKALSKQHHPDVAGGSESLMSEINAARAAALKEVDRG